MFLVRNKNYVCVCVHVNEKHTVEEYVFDCWLCVYVLKETCEVWLRRSHKKICRQKDGKFIFVAIKNVSFFYMWTPSCHYNKGEFWLLVECRYRHRQAIFIIMKCLRVLACVVYWPWRCSVRLSARVSPSKAWNKYVLLITKPFPDKRFYFCAG